MNIKKVKEWAKAHEVTLMMIGSAIAGAAGFYICDKFVFKKDVTRTSDIDITITNRKDSVGIGLSELLPNGKHGTEIFTFCSPIMATEVAESLIGAASDIMGKDIKIEAVSSQK